MAGQSLEGEGNELVFAADDLVADADVEALEQAKGGVRFENGGCIIDRKYEYRRRHSSKD